MPDRSFPRIAFSFPETITRKGKRSARKPEVRVCQRRVNACESRVHLCSRRGLYREKSVLGRCFFFVHFECVRPWAMPCKISRQLPRVHQRQAHFQGCRCGGCSVRSTLAGQCLRSIAQRVRTADSQRIRQRASALQRRWSDRDDRSALHSGSRGCARIARGHDRHWCSVAARYACRFCNQSAAQLTEKLRIIIVIALRHNAMLPAGGTTRVAGCAVGWVATGCPRTRV